MSARLARTRGAASQKAHAESLGVALRTYQNYERGEREPSLDVLGGLVAQGWSAHWLLTGEGPERLNSDAAHAASHAAGLTPGNVQAAAGAIAAVLRHLGVESKPSAIARAVVALAADLDRRGVAKAQVEDLLEAAKAHLITTGSTDGRSE